MQPGRNVSGCICPLHNRDIQLQSPGLPLKLSFIKNQTGQNKKSVIGAGKHALHASYDLPFSTLFLKYKYLVKLKAQETVERLRFH